MSHSTLFKTKRKATAHYEALADELLAEMHHLNELIGKDHLEIERMKSETDELRAETLRQKTETREALTRLGAKL